MSDVPRDDAPIELEPLEPVSDPVATARRRHGAAGAIVAAGMLGIDQVLGRKPREEAPVVIAASDQPTDIDTDGIRVAVDEHTDVVAPPLPRRDGPPPATPSSRSPRRR